MKVLFIASNTHALGGIQQYNRKFLSVLKLRGDKVSLIELKSGGFFARIIFVVKSIIYSITLKPDLTVCAHINYAPIGLFLKRSLGRKYIVCTHGIDVWNIRSRMKLRALKEAKLITTVAEFTRDKIISQLPEVKNKIFLLYNPVDGERFKPKEKSISLIERFRLKDKKVILTIARLSAEEGYKGYDRVIEAMPKVIKSVPNAKYLLAGKGDDSPRIKKLIEDMNLQNTVVMAGYVPEEEIVDYYNLADVFLMPSKAEGAPAVFVEALACGVPVIAGNKDGSGTPLQGGETGLLVDPDNVNEIAETIIGVLTGEVDENILDRRLLRDKTLKKFGLELFPKRVDEVMRIM